MEEARAKVAMIVGRDVDRYQAPDIARATVETVAENFVDGVLSPLILCGPRRSAARHGLQNGKHLGFHGGL